MMADPADALGLGRTPPHDYGEHQPTRWRAPWARGAVTALTAIGALVVGFLLATGLSAGREVAIAQSERKDELIRLITERQEHTDELAAELDALRGRVTDAEEAAVAGLPTLQEDLAEVERAAGLTAVGGPGLVVTFDDASGECPQQPMDCRIQDVDLQLAVNTLFDLGAEALAIDGERIMATTSVRGAGQLVLVNHRVLSPPYEIVAVGDPQALEAGMEASQLAADFAVWEDDYGLAFDYEADDDLVVPAYAGSLRVTVAEPGADGTDGRGGATGETDRDTLGPDSDLDALVPETDVDALVPDSRFDAVVPETGGEGDER